MQKRNFRGFKLFHQNSEATESMIRQIDQFPSFFSPTSERPWIIDCGANIGVSVLEWKTRWPQSQIVCFEPDPFAFQLLQTNVDRNDIPGIQCVNVALADIDGTATLYGDVASGGDARGNSIDASWGNRAGSVQTSVNCQRLSRYVADREVSFLKLDIEGAEERVLTEIAPHLGNVEAAYVEVHETDQNAPYNSAARIEQLLRDAGFVIETETRHDEHALPARLDSWRRAVGARQTQLLCWR
jgi:FkbM family methyltransferase